MRPLVTKSPPTLNLNASGEIPPKPTEYSPSVYFLFLFFAVYLALPLIDVPLLGLSLSAPVFFLVALPVLLRPTRPWFNTYRHWIILAVAIWVGIFISAMINGLVSSGVQIDSGGWISLVRFAYWLLVFVVTVYLASSQPGLLERIVWALSLGITILAIIRLGEAVFGGAIGAWMSLRVLSQNMYGLQFSMLLPVLFSLIFGRVRRNFVVIASLAIVVAVLLNGSRSNWVASVVGIGLVLWMIFFTQGRRFRYIPALFLLICFLALLVNLAPGDVVYAFEQRLGTFDKLEQDKSYMIRQLMVQKGIRLFAQNPLFGVGVSRWTKESIPLELPLVLQYSPQSDFDRRSAHNSYISFLAENGLAGMLPFGKVRCFNISPC
ncbi:O-antigen ligase family protein [Patescibacteria group bacterium]|nr:O-antigen ligase family protein [Patescibacteria group bacterium]